MSIFFSNMNGLNPPIKSYRVEGNKIHIFCLENEHNLNIKIVVLRIKERQIYKPLKNKQKLLGQPYISDQIAFN